MDFELSDEQRMLADSLRRYLQDEYGFERRRRIARQEHGFNRDVWTALAEMGVLGLTIAQEYGGFGEGAASQLVVQRELGRALVLEPVTPCAVIAAAVLAKHGNADQKTRYLPPMAQGLRIVVPAWLEPGTRYAEDGVAASARRVADGYVLSGRKTLVWHADVADALLVTALVEGDETPTMFLVETSLAGVGVASYPTLDGMRAGDVTLDGVAVASQDRIGLEGAGQQAMRWGEDHGIAALCAEAGGAMERLIEMTSEYLSARRQFGKALGSFQALQHRMADMVIQKELAVSMAYVAAQALDESDAGTRCRKLAAAKFMMAKAARFVGQQAVQLHGGMGMTDELAVGDYFKRLTMLDPLLGDSDHHLDRYGRLLAA
ncbi:acyl-CoA dehydrogenase family protein [Achromobacter pestifer]|uniref:Acyl-CoA dehydrogenase family protein n=1 Tax=Achromobacter pestifer TaxID=1353889 RepID=A0A7D4HSC3_9BURK|nr:acyl-CoA dehydrogenase family protein [Achromobacter pestifer]QKH36897.1 acyl-CoA dehydrogenase family protein [Achromobacter pestifer]